jgi:methylenetetrahydrofolate dehydrogenase (NADP+)/methenyltetrahydrofolate cyclohydrolase
MSGRRIAEEIKVKIKEEIIALGSIRPNLATILVGDNPSSKTYLKNKHVACLEVGIGSRNIELPTTTSQRELESLLRNLSDDPSVTGILLQLPLPKGLNDVSAIEAISPEKDVDGLHPHNLGLLLQGSSNLVPCTPKGVVVILRYYGIPILGSHAVIINRSKLVGRPLSQLLLKNDATVTVCHSKTKELPHVCKEADILITGIGHRTEFAVGASLVKTGATVVDIGTSVINGKVTGDVDFADASKIAGHITPVPGGVGPMTIAMLLYNTLLAACKLCGKRLAFDPETLRYV